MEMLYVSSSIARRAQEDCLTFVFVSRMATVRSEKVCMWLRMCPTQSQVMYALVMIVFYRRPVHPYSRRPPWRSRAGLGDG